MKKILATVVNHLGLHARPAAMLASRASSFQSTISIQRGPKKANAKSIMALMLLAAPAGAQLGLEADGDDEEEALAEISAMFANAFGEHPQ